MRQVETMERVVDALICRGGGYHLQGVFNFQKINTFKMEIMDIYRGIFKERNLSGSDVWEIKEESTGLVSSSRLVKKLNSQHNSSVTFRTHYFPSEIIADFEGPLVQDKPNVNDNPGTNYNLLVMSHFDESNDKKSMCSACIIKTAPPAS
jgi:hypothetical protein